MSPLDRLLTTGFHHPIGGATIEEGYAAFLAQADEPLDLSSFANVVAEAVKAGLIEEPVVLPDGALSCHWRLRLTSKGVAQVRQLSS